jgi:hypothetical protein
MGSGFGTVRGAPLRALDEVARAGQALHVLDSPAVRAGLVDELARVAVSYEPKLGSMSTMDVARGRALVRDALDGLQVVPVVNRWHRPGVPVVDAPDALMGTVHTLPPRNVADRVMRFVRERWETSRNMHGPGPLAGHTIFASAQFVPRSTVAAHGGDVVAAARELSDARGSLGIARFGDRAHVLDESVLARASASGRDSGLGPTAARLAPMERFDDVVLERLARSHGFRHDPLVGANGYRLGIDGAGSAPARRESLRELLHDTPNEVAVERLRGYLTGPTLTDIDHMVELQVRGVRGRDILATMEEHTAAGVNAVGI